MSISHSTKRISRRDFLKLVGIASGATALAGCAGETPTPTTLPTVMPSAATLSTLAAPTATAAPVASPTVEIPLYKDPAVPIEDRVADLLSRMTVDEKIGQMTQAERTALVNDEHIAEFRLGSILSGGNSAPSPNRPETWADMVDGYQEQALSTRLGIPLLYGYDAVHGNSKVVGAVIFPHNIGMGAMRDPELAEQAGRITALEVVPTGIRWTFSPCITVPQDERWGRTYEGFGEDPELVSTMGAATIRGYQGGSLGDPTSILATAKHFVGDGGTLGGVDRGDTQIDEPTLRRIHLAPYIAAVNAGAGSVMASFNSWNGEKMHGNHYLLTDVLKGELGFQGFVVSDWQAIDQLPGNYRSDVNASINAGIDMVMVPNDYATFVATLRELVEGGDVPLERIDDAVSRILRIKFELGLFEHPYADRTLMGEIGSAEHREVARQAVRESLVLLRNQNGLLPLPKDLAHIFVTGRNADNIGNQCGGWSITWQGRGGSITTGTTILQAIQDTVSPATTVTYSRDGSGAEGTDVAIVVVGEEPYAEFSGDSSNLVLSRTDLQTIEKVRAAGVPVVVILISGRPLIIEQELENWDALIAAWLPGTEGQGVADVLFGDYSPTGKLPCSWPRTMSQIPINAGDDDYDPLFPYGFGSIY